MSVNFKIISLEGNIGAGKSTLLQKLKDNYKHENNEIIFVDEPVDIWGTFKDSITGETMLEKFYKNPTNYAFSFQIMAFTTRVQVLQNAISKNPHARLFVCERSLEADKHIFAKMLHDDGLIDDVMYQVYERSFQQYLGQMQNLGLDGMIYINTDPVTCFDRIMKRGRDGEEKIDITYLTRCHDYHTKWLSDINIPVLSTSSNYNTEKHFAIHKFLQQVLIEPFSKYNVYCE